MKVLKERNVNGMFHEGLRHLSHVGEQQSSRNGDVIVAPHPVVSVYSRPTERVLFCDRRDANPFFHLMESLWMLSGRDDSKFLDNYVQDFGTRFAEQGHHVHGAYGARWRNALGFDQLDAVVERLRANPDDRQCVLQMWDARMEYVGGVPVGENDLRGTWLDRPCNTHVYLRVRDERVSSATIKVLDLTVCCRSNDIVWGAYGSNAVHFSVLQEYLAGRIGVEVGTMYQFSNNLHGYLVTLDKLGDPNSLDSQDPYDNGEVRSLSMGHDWNSWDADLCAFIEFHDWLWGPNYSQTYRGDVYGYQNDWFSNTAVPVAEAYRARNRGDMTNALQHAHQITASDWRCACVSWLERRVR